MNTKTTHGYAVVRPDGSIQLDTQGIFEVYNSLDDAIFIRDKAFSGFTIKPVVIHYDDSYLVKITSPTDDRTLYLVDTLGHSTVDRALAGRFPKADAEREAQDVNAQRMPWTAVATLDIPE